jgi:transposase
MTIIPDLPDLIVEPVDVTETITLTLRTIAPTATCPVCGTASTRVQSRYTRTRRDVPASGRSVRLILRVRRFFCRASQCARKIYAETFPDPCRPYAQRTLRLQEVLCQLELESGGQAGSRIARQVGLSGSRDTFLRLIRRHPLPQLPPARIVGVDDFAWQRGKRYGTLICDLEQGWPLDLLPDRSVETVSAWLSERPQIDIVSRDGSTDYAAAITKGAPQATQVSDRWQLVKNLAHCVSELLAHHLTEIRRTERATQTVQAEIASTDHDPLPASTLSPAQRARQEERAERYAHLLALHEQGMRSEEIAEQVGMSVRSVHRRLAHGTIPTNRRRWRPAPRLDPYKAYLLERWKVGCQNRAQLFREVRERGYQGTERAIYRYLATSLPGLPPKQRSRTASQLEKPVARPVNPLLTLSVRQATWLFFRRPEERTEDDRHLLSLLRQAHPSLDQVYMLVTAFLHIVRERTGEHLDPWLAEVQASHLEELSSLCGEYPRGSHGRPRGINACLE